MTDACLDDLCAELQEVLNNLHNPLYEPSERLLALFGCPPCGVPQAIISAINEMQPPAHAPADAPSRRYYRILVSRYLEGMTQETVAESMGISARYLRDLQRSAVRSLSLRLLEETSGDTRPDLARELAVLEQSAPCAVAHVGDAARSALELAQVLEGTRRLSLELGSVPVDAQVRMHPAVLKQALLHSIEELIECSAVNGISITAEPSVAGNESWVTVQLTGRLAQPVQPGAGFSLDMIGEILTAHGGQTELSADDVGVVISLRLPTAPPDRLHVLVVDDNRDLVSFYRAFVVGTAYEISHLSDGTDVLRYAETHRPDLVVLDVMLPDPEMDGWDLLIQLRNHPSTRHIPVIVCSVIRDQQLALALGAAQYLPKPVRRRDFLAALDAAQDRLVEPEATANSDS